MATIAIMIGGALLNATAFSGGSYLTDLLSSRDPKVDQAETARYDKVMQKFDADSEAYRRARESLANWEEEQEMIRQQDLDDMTATNRSLDLYAHMHPQPYVPDKLQWNDYYHPSSSQRTGEMITVGGGMLALTYAASPVFLNSKRVFL